MEEDVVLNPLSHMLLLPVLTLTAVPWAAAGRGP